MGERVEREGREGERERGREGERERVREGESERCIPVVFSLIMILRKVSFNNPQSIRSSVNMSETTPGERERERKRDRGEREREIHIYIYI